MSLIVTIRTTEGAVMAADSRTTWSTTLSPDKTMVGIHFSDTANKLFLVGNRVGVSTCGDASVKGRSISSWMDEFIDVDCPSGESVSSIAGRLGEFFCNLKPKKNVAFHVTGYEDMDDGHTVLAFYKVNVSHNGEYAVSNAARGCGAAWDGEIVTISRLIKDCFIADVSDIVPVKNLVINSKDSEGKEITTNLGDVTAISPKALHFPEATIMWRSFTLQEAIDFAVYAIRTTIATMRFQSQPVTVGEPIDLLVIKPHQAMWLSKKELHMS